MEKIKETEKLQLHSEELKIKSKELELESKELDNEISRLKHELEIANAKLKWYEEQFRLNAVKKYGKSSDDVNEEQISFFNEAEINERPEIEEPTVEKITYERKRRRGVNKASFENLPVERIEYEIPEEERTCEIFTTTMHEMTVEIRKEIKVVPATVSIVEHVRKIYSCRKCEREGVKANIITAKMPEPVIKGSFVSPSLLAYLIYQKYSAALPLDRQEKIFRDYGIDISKQNMSNWIIKGSEL